MAKRVSVQINGKWIRDLLVMESQYPGFDPLGKTRFPARQLIAYKRLKPDEQAIIYGNGRRYESIAIMWDAERDAPVASSATVESTTPSKADNFEPSDYQKAILKTLLETTDDIEIKAYAGSGKTATLVWLVQQLFRLGQLPKRVVFLAYNKTIEEELNVRLRGTGCPAKTTHSFGYAALKNAFGNGVDLNNRRTSELFLQVMCDHAELDYSDASFKTIRQSGMYKIRSAVLELVSHCKNDAILPKCIDNQWVFNKEDEKQARKLFDHYEIEIPLDEKNNPLCSPEDIISFALRTLSKSVPVNGKLDCVAYDDMLWLPLVLNLNYGHYDLVLCDESQDFNMCQIKMLEKLATE